MINRNTRQKEQDYMDKRRQAHKIWKFLIITMNQEFFLSRSEQYKKMIPTTNVTDCR